MPMQELLQDFINTIDGADVGKNELFNMEMIAAKECLFMYTPTLKTEQIQVILEHLQAGVSVSLLTTKKMRYPQKRAVAEKFFSENTETKSKWDKFIVIGYVIIVVGVILIGASLLATRFGYPITRGNEVYRLMLPLLEIYLGFVISDFAFKQKYTIRPLHDNLSVDVFKRDKDLPKATLYLTDSKRIIYQKQGEDQMGISHVKIIENPVVVDQLSQLIGKELPLTKREGLTLSDLRDYLLD